MTAEARARLIGAHLEAVSRGRSPTSEQVGIWLRELEDIPMEDLDDTIRLARRHHAEQTDKGKRWGKLTPDDVLHAYKSERKVAEVTPHNPECQYRCDDGLVSLLDGKGLSYAVRCVCFAGKSWDRHAVFGKRCPNVEQAIGQLGWTPAKQVPTMPASHADWLQKRTAQVGFLRASNEYRDWMDAREP